LQSQQKQGQWNEFKSKDINNMRAVSKNFKKIFCIFVNFCTLVL